ncbi:hypothetical protein CBL_21324, partial [Carabus blaptoides fortunei]
PTRRDEPRQRSPTRNRPTNSNNDTNRFKDYNCYICNKKGHLARNCRQRNEEPNKNIVLAIQTENTNQKYFVDAFINDKPIRAYIDFGSSCVTIREVDAIKTNLTITNANDGVLTGYGSGSVKPLGTSVANIRAFDVNVTVKIFVVPNSTQSIPLIVGHPFTESPDVV